MSFIHVRSSATAVVFILLICTLVFAVTPITEQSLLLRDSATLIPLLVLSTVVPAFLIGILASPMSLDESFPLWPGVLLRGAWLIGWSAALCLIATLLFLTRFTMSDFLFAALRNLLFGCGITAIAAVWLPLVASWLPLVAYGLLCWFLGVSESTNLAEGWALPHHPWSLGIPELITALIYALGITLYVGKGPLVRN